MASPTFSRRLPPLLATLLLTPLLPPGASLAQTVGPHSLQGDWVRVVSNNNPNDQMRVTINGDAILTSVPAAASPYWQVGQVLWRGIQNDGSLEVRGSDGQYYSATLTFNGPDEVSLAISLRTAGDAQTWRRAGPSIDGDWVLVAPAGGPNDGLRVRVQSQQAAIRFLPPTSPRAMRVGGRVWQNIGPRGTIDVLGSDRQFHAATYTLIDPNTLKVDATAIAGGAGQIWVRPGAVQGARATLAAGGTLAAPPSSPNQPGSNLQPLGTLPGAPRTPATPPIPPATPAACLATSLSSDRLGLRWEMEMYTPSNDPGRAETAGLRGFMVSGVPATWSGGRSPADIEYSAFPGLQDGLVWIRDDGGSRRVFRDQTASQLDGRIQAARPAGERPVDLEGQGASGGMVYSTIWESNIEGIDWRVDYDLSEAEYRTRYQSRRAAGYRLIDTEAFDTPSGVRYGAIWWASCDSGNWKHEFDISRQAYQTRVNQESALGFRVIDFESRSTPSGQRYSAIWERIPSGRDWAVRTDRDLRQFLNWHHRYVDEGMRLVDFESYDTPGGARYAGVWAENDARYDYPFKADVDAAIQSYRAARGVPGISVVVMQDDEVIYRRGFGWADSAQQKQAHAGTIYITASIAKAIGATVAARLEERGIIDLSDRTRSVLTNMPSGHTHTLDQLLAKTGCIVHYAEIRNRAEPDTTRVYAWQIDAAARIWKDPMLSNCTPGSQYHYSTHGFTFVGAALEEVTGKPFGDILRDELTSPFGLRSMGLMVSGRWGGFPPPGVRPYDLARGYERHPTKWGWRVEANYENASWKPLGGGLQTNALDLARFGWLTLDGQIVSPTTRDTRLWRALSGSVTDWSDGSRPPTTGLAWVLDGRGPRIAQGSGSRARRSAEHGGTARGAKSLLRIYRDDGLTIAILSNQSEDLSARTGNHQPPGLATTIATLVFQNPPPP